jgi:ABC-2 type transport system ATP-binding protein
LGLSRAVIVEPASTGGLSPAGDTEEACGPLPLRLIDLGRRYRRARRWGVRHVDLQIPTGSVTAVVGPNGAGKSTLLRSCVGFERPDEGRVEVFGLAPRRQAAAALRLVAYVPQASSLYPHLTIQDHFTLSGVARPTFDVRYASERIEEAQLSLDRRVGELSGGERAKVALAIAVGTQAPLLLLDEPLASLDPLSRREFLGLVASDSKRRGTTVLLASHLIDEVELVCDRLVVLGHGRVLLESSIAEAKAAFRAITDRPSNSSVIGRFMGRTGDAMALVPANSSGGMPATVEEVVLGHLAHGRGPSEILD